MGGNESKHRRVLLTAAQMRALERYAMEHCGVTGLELMERAGRGVVDAILAEWPELAEGPHRAVVLCGPGNNGGDGFVVARLLRNRGWDVNVFLYGEPEKLPQDARANHDRWAAMGEIRRLGFPEVAPRDAAEVVRAVGDACDLFVDAIFGTGLVRAPDGLSALFEAEERNRLGPGVHRVAVDAPTGLCADSGRSYPKANDDMIATPVLCADLTVTFGCAKPGHFLGRGPAACGKLVLCDIGLPEPAVDSEAGQSIPADTKPVVLIGAPPSRLVCKQEGHKYSHGHAVILSGGFGRTGAARMAAGAALRVGAGLVTVFAPEDAMAECAAQLTAVMLRQCDGAGDLQAMLKDERLNAVCLGPGLGRGQEARDLVMAVLDSMPKETLRHPGRSAVLDADALTAFEDRPEELFEALEAFGAPNDRVVLTPHMGEFARLFPDIADSLKAPPERGPAYSRVDAARAAAERASAVLLLKGPDTVIAAPDGAASVNAAAYELAAPWLATAGAGDVLSGLIAGLMARGLGARAAPEAAAWLHVAAALEVGPGLIAEDLPEALPPVFARLQGRAA